MFSLTYTRTEMMNKKWKWVKTDLIFFIQLKKRYNVYVRLKSWPFEIRSSWSCCIKIFLDAIANQLRHNVCFVAHIPRWHTSISLSEEPFGCRSQRHWQGHGHFKKDIHEITGTCLKQYFWRLLKALCWSDENWKVLAKLNGYMGLWGPHWGLNLNRS